MARKIDLEARMAERLLRHAAKDARARSLAAQARLGRTGKEARAKATKAASKAQERVAKDNYLAAAELQRRKQEAERKQAERERREEERPERQASALLVDTFMVGDEEDDEDQDEDGEPKQHAPGAAVFDAFPRLGDSVLNGWYKVATEQDATRFYALLWAHARGWPIVGQTALALSVDDAAQNARGLVQLMPAKYRKSDAKWFTLAVFGVQYTGEGRGFQPKTKRGGNGD